MATLYVLNDYTTEGYVLESDGTPVFPLLPSGALPDSSKFGVKLEDNTISYEVEGAYRWTRPRSTRRSRRTFQVAYTYIDNVDRLVIEEHYNECAGGARMFEWENPEDQQIYRVRFVGAIDFQYRGRGYMKRWDCSFELEQV